MHTTTPGHGGSASGRARKYGTATGGIVRRVITLVAARRGRGAPPPPLLARSLALSRVRPVGDLRVGIYVPQLAFSYEDLLARAKQCEELGFDSFWCFDHLYGPELPATPA